MVADDHEEEEAQMSAARIGLVAVSGVRVYKELLQRLAVTLPGFVERARVIASMPSLGLLTLAGATPSEYEVTYLECPELDASALEQYSFDHREARLRPEVVAYAKR
jgi:hypothetical protein